MKRTDTLMLEGGQWVRVAPKHYRHVTGVEVVYGHNEWLWFVRGGPHDGEGYGTLDVARYYAEQAAAN